MCTYHMHPTTARDQEGSFPLADNVAIDGTRKMR